MAISIHRESISFGAVLAVLIGGMLHASLLGKRVLSPGDVVYATASFSDGKTGDYEPANRLLMDPVLQFQPWLEFSRNEMRACRLPLWNPLVGCGAPHLANGQSAVFDPFHFIAYFGTLPEAHAWMAFARLWVAGLGLFLLARSWGQSPPARWLAGLSYPLSGFLMAWLFYPVTSVAVWLPWLFLATDRALNGRRFGIASVAVVVGFAMLGGHVQTSAHVLLAAGLYALWRIARERGCLGRRSIRWSVGVTLGLALAAIEIVPLATYLSKSPVWADRIQEKPSPVSITRPRVLEAATTALPYLFGSQRRGQPNLAKALGLQNLNESAGGFAGLATLIWLAPAAWSARKQQPRVVFLMALGIAGALAAFAVFPAPNLLRLIPILDVADNRRLTLWVAFSLVLLGGFGLDATTHTLASRGWTIWTRSWFALAALLAGAACAVMGSQAIIREKSLAHYEKSARETPGANPAIYRERAERQTRLTLTFLPRYYLIGAAHLIVLAALAEVARHRSRAHDRLPSPVRAALSLLVLVDLVAFGYDLNPSIDRADDRPDSALIQYLRRECAPPHRIISVGSEIPPNTLLRYGLADARNYDSMELSRNVALFDRLFEAEPDGRPARTSRRPITWGGVGRSIAELKLARVSAIVAASPPPNGLFSRVDRVGKVWVARIDSETPAPDRKNPREIRVDLRADPRQVGWTAETFDPGWTAEVDNQPTAVVPYRGAFLAVPLSPGLHRIVFRYNPLDVQIASVVSMLAVLLIGVFACVERSPENSKP